MGRRIRRDDVVVAGEWEASGVGEAIVGDNGLNFKGGDM